MAENLFLKPEGFYQRDIDPIQQYLQQTAFYLSKVHNKPLSECLLIAQHAAKQGKNPKVRFFERNDNGDRFVQEQGLIQYINEAKQQGDIIAPTFTTYLHPTQERSMLVEFTDNNKKRRGTAKKEAFQAKAAGLLDLYVIKNNEQTNMKLYNNSMSGAFATRGSVLYNPTGHNTLTSLTRSETAVSNASNEKILTGNRHYYDPDVTLYNLISIASDLNRDELQRCVSKYVLHIPTVEEVMACVRYSTDLYWHDKRALDRILEFVMTLDELERLAVVYIGDLYHIRLYNDALIRTFLMQLSQKVTDQIVQDPLATVEAADEQIINLVHQIASDTMAGKGKDYASLTHEEQQWIACTCLNVERTVAQYKDFIEALFLTKHLPASVAYLPSMMRRTVTVSDTDSTLFSVDMWVQWYFGNIVFNEASDGLAASVMYFATQCMAHGLALFSANINVERPKLFDMQMKPEFAFPMLAQTPVAKHYFSAIKVKEGNVYAEIEMEIKGVNLKSSANAVQVRDHGTLMMRHIAETILANKRISMKALLTDIANLERDITASLLKGEPTYLKKSKIKPPESYASSPEASPYFYHTFWQTVFGPKYQLWEEPPYGTIKIPTTVSNISSLSRWLHGIEDKALAERLAAFLAAHKKVKLPTVYLSDIYIKAYGIPDEIKQVMDIKRVILDLTSMQRMVCATLGYLIKEGYLVSETGY